MYARMGTFFTSEFVEHLKENFIRRISTYIFYVFFMFINLFVVSHHIQLHKLNDIKYVATLIRGFSY